MNRPALFSIALVILFAASATAQPPGGGFGDRGGGDRGGRGGGDRGGGGGDRGGRGGPGGPGGPGGGFDPSGFLSRLDRNGDGKLSPDEQEGPAGSMIRRLESIDKKIKPGATVSISRIAEAFQKMREGGDSDRDRSSGDDRNRSSRGAEESIEMEPLVPGFGIEQPDYVVPGFGPSAEMFSVPVTDADRQQAQEVLDRYDRNKDGQIDKEEMSRGRFWGTPLDFDRNSDGKLSAMELATRQAVRRTREEAEKGNRDKGDSKRKRDETSETVSVDFEGRNSYRVYAETAPEGLPRFYSERDLNRDGQVSMSEYTSDWTEARIAEFYGWDSNRDGTITVAEIQSGVTRGLVASDAPSGAAPVSSIPMASSQGKPNEMSKNVGSESSSKPLASPKLDVTGIKPDEKMLSYAKNIISRNDKNNDGALTPDEWASMLMSPAPADLNGDGRVTIPEYATYRQAQRSPKR